MNSDLQKPLNPNHKFEAIEEDDNDDEVGLRAVRIANAIAFPMVLKAALELGVIDAIHAAGDGALLSPSDIASRLPTKPSNPQAPMLLDRMLRLLASHSIVKCRTVRTGAVHKRVYGTEPVCRFLLKESEGLGSVVPMFLIFHHDSFIKTWTHLKEVIMEGGDAFHRAHGEGLFEHAESNKEFGELFNQAMSEYSVMMMKKVLKIYRGFEGVNVLVDVGGGNGTNLGIIISKYHHIKGINFDLSNVIAEAPPLTGVEQVSGDMFVDIPKGDAIFMKWILHDWNDENCLKILKNCWRALTKKGKVIIVDTVLPDEPKNGEMYSNISFDLDMTMLSQCSGGKERTRAEFQNLAFSSGFVRCEFIYRIYHCWVIEFYKETSICQKFQEISDEF